MNAKDLFKRIQELKGVPLRDPTLGPREVKDKALDALERQRQAQLNEQRKVYLKAQIAEYQRVQSSRSIHDGINHLAQQRNKFKKPPQMRLFERGNL
jgi:hypothetical protein